MKYLTTTILLTLLVLGGCGDSEPRPKVISLDNLPEVSDEPIHKIDTKSKLASEYDEERIITFDSVSNGLPPTKELLEVYNICRPINHTRTEMKSCMLRTLKILADQWDAQNSQRSLSNLANSNYGRCLAETGSFAGCHPNWTPPPVAPNVQAMRVCVYECMGDTITISDNMCPADISYQGVQCIRRR